MPLSTMDSKREDSSVDENSEEEFIVIRSKKLLLRDRVKQLLDENEGLEFQMKSLEIRIGDKDKEISALSKINNYLNEKINKTDEKSVKLEESEEKIKPSGDLSSEETQTEVTANELDTQRKIIEDLKDKCNNLELTRDMFEVEYNLLIKKNEVLEGKCKESDERRSEQTQTKVTIEELKERERRIKDVECVCQTLKDLNEKLETRCRQLESESRRDVVDAIGWSPGQDIDRQRQLETENQTLQLIVDDMAERSRELEASRAEMEISYLAMESEKLVLNDRVGLLEQRLREMDSKLVDLRTYKPQRPPRLRMDPETAKALQDKDKKIKHLEDVSKFLEATRLRLENKSKEVEIENKSLNIRNEFLEEKCRRLESETENDKRRNEEMVLIHKTQCQDVVNAIQELEKDNQAMKLAVDDMNKSRIEVENCFRAKESRNRTLNDRVNQMELSLKDIDDKLVESEESRQHLQTENNTLKDQLEDLSYKCQQLDNNNRFLMNEIVESDRNRQMNMVQANWYHTLLTEERNYFERDLKELKISKHKLEDRVSKIEATMKKCFDVKSDTTDEVVVSLLPDEEQWQLMPKTDEIIDVTDESDDKGLVPKACTFCDQMIFCSPDQRQMFLHWEVDHCQCVCPICETPFDQTLSDHLMYFDMHMKNHNDIPYPSNRHFSTCVTFY